MLAALVLVAAACGHPDPEGAYTMTATRASGTCPDDRGAPRTVVIGPDHAMRFLGVPGECPLARADAVWVGKCDLVAGGVWASIVWQLTFTDAGFWGSSHEAYFTALGPVCTGVFEVTGTRLPVGGSTP